MTRERPLPRRMREVVDTNATTLSSRVSDRLQGLDRRSRIGRLDATGIPERLRSEGRPQLVHRRAERRRLRHAGRAEQLRASEVERQRLAPGEPQRTGEVLGHRDPDAIVLVDVHLDEVAGSVRRQAGHEQQVEVPAELIDGHVERPRHLRQLAPRMLHQVRDDHEHPAQSFRRLRCPPSPLRQGAPPGGRRSDRGATAGPPRRRPDRAGAGSERAHARPRPAP